ncbi:MAG: lytic murein transglycosylase B [Gammaproteobacteria bacterium]|nr:lytic murein transglycosylase B [Gammaproteobacteria bacterium]
MLVNRVLSLSVLLFGAVFATTVNADISDRHDVRQFIDQMVKEHQFKEEELVKIFQKVSINNKIIDAITRPAEAKPWHKYRPIFLTDKRINGGLKFWKKHEEALQRAYDTYGVPPEIVISIIGVESLYGKHKGRYGIVESLATLGFNYPKRSTFFRKELAEFLLLAREEGKDPLSLKGSYAGAMGKPQFIASSFRRYAVDFDGDGKRDLWDNSVDVIGSVANYFAKHKWQRDEPIAGRAKVKGKKYKGLVEKGIRPNTSLKAMARLGVKTKGEFNPDHEAALIELEQKKGNEYWVGLNNFYVITRYNHNELYAMAVYQLSKAIVKKRKVDVANNK